VSAAPWDIKLTVTGGQEHGFMLVTPQGQTKQLSIEEVGGPDSQRISTEAIATHQDFNPQQDTPFAQSSWLSGAGQLEFDLKDDAAYWFGVGVVTHVDGKGFLAPPENPQQNLPSSAGEAITGFTTHVEQSGQRWDFCWAGPRLYRRDASNASNPWALVWTQPQGVPITSFAVYAGQGVICAPTDTSTVDFWLQGNLAAAPTWTPSGMDHTAFNTGKPKFMCSVRSTLFAAVDTNRIFYTVSPGTNSWAGPIVTTVESISVPAAGDASYPFTGLMAANDYLYAFKASAGYSVDSAQNINEIFWQWKDKPDLTNFRYLAPSMDLLLFSVSPEVYAYDPGTGATMSLGLSKRDGFSCDDILGVAADNQYVYVLARLSVRPLYAQPIVALLRGVRVQGRRWSLECIWADTSPSGKSYANLFASPAGTGTRLYWGLSTGGGTRVCSMDIPGIWDESLGYAFAKDGVLYTSITRAGFPGFTKRHLWLGVFAEGVTGGNSITVDYSTDGGLTWTNLGNPPHGMSRIAYANVYSPAIVLRFRFSGDGTGTAVLRSFDHHQRVRFRYLERVTAAVRVEDYLELNNGVKTLQTMEDVKNSLEALRTEDRAILYEDFLGNSFYVTVDQISYRPTRHEDPYGKAALEAVMVMHRAEVGS